MHYADYKTILSAQNGMNVYRGCTHGCIYCDSRSKCYQINHSFEDIEVKRDAAKILENQLKRKRNRCMVATGAMTDPYIHLEEKLMVTRSCIEVVDRLGFGLAIQTKSSRILRDIDLLKSINANTKCVVQMTLTTYDDKLCKILEPNVSTTSERFSVLMEMKKAGIPTVVWLSPFLPFINDTADNLLGLLEYCAEAGVKGVIFYGIGLTLREGNREYFYEKLDEHFPGLKSKYINYFGNNYVCNSPNNKQLTKTLQTFCRKHGIIYKMNEVFDYLHKFEYKEEQLSLF